CVGVLAPVGTVNSVMSPAGVIRPIRPASSVNQTLPSGPAVMPAGRLAAVRSVNSWIVTLNPPVPMAARPILFPGPPRNQIAPSGPAAMPHGVLAAVGTSNSWNAPTVSIQAILLTARSVNHRNGAPAGPWVSPNGSAFAVGTGRSITDPLSLTSAILLALV